MSQTARKRREELHYYAAILKALEFDNSETKRSQNISETLLKPYKSWPLLPEISQQPPWALRDAIEDVVVTILEAGDHDAEMGPGDSHSGEKPSPVDERGRITEAVGDANDEEEADSSESDENSDDEGDEDVEGGQKIGVEDEGEESDDSNESLSRVPAPFIDALTSQVSDVLTRTFALITSHRPAYYRHLKPFDGRAILDMLTGSNIVSPTVLEETRRRLEQRFPDDPRRPPHLGEGYPESGPLSNPSETASSPSARIPMPRSVRVDAASWDLFNIVDVHVREKRRVKKRKREEVEDDDLGEGE